MFFYSCIFSLLLTLFTFSTAPAGNPQMLIKQISHDLEQTRNPQAKSVLHVYRARQYAKMKNLKMALENYNDALKLNHKGWIHLERGHFLLTMGKYELAYEDANAAKEEVPTLTCEADKVIEKAVEEIRKKYEAENPITIIMDTRADPYRKTRFDVKRERGIVAVNKSYRRRPVSRKKQSKAACTTKSRS